MNRSRFAAPLVFAGFFAGSVLVPEPVSGQGLPPSAAPITAVEIAPLPVVRSQSQQVEDYANGLVRGLVNAHRIHGLALIAVDADRIMVRKSEGVTDPVTKAPVNIDSVFPVGGIGDVIVGIALMQQIEQAKLLTSRDVGEVLEDSSLSGIVVSQVLSHQVPQAPELMARLLAHVSGQAVDAYVQTHVLIPLGMTHSRFEAGRFSTSASDMGRLLLALLNGGGVEDARVLAPETVDLMFRANAGAHQAIPGWGYVLAEHLRGGWRGLQYDGRDTLDRMTIEARLVFVPEAKRGYFVALNADAGPEFWRVLDDSLFDQLMPPRENTEPVLNVRPPPTAEEGHRMAGLYLPAPDLRSEAVFLKTPQGMLKIDGRGDGALILSGAVEAVLTPEEGGYWHSDEAQLVAAMENGVFHLGDTAYGRFRLIERPTIYAWLALVFGLAGTIFAIRPEFLPRVIPMKSRFVVHAGEGLLAAAYVFLLLAVVLERLALAAQTH